MNDKRYECGRFEGTRECLRITCLPCRNRSYKGEMMAELTQDDLRDIRALIEAVEKRRRFLGVEVCGLCFVPIEMNQHKPDCAVTIARRLKQRLEGM